MSEDVGILNGYPGFPDSCAKRESEKGFAGALGLNFLDFDSGGSMRGEAHGRDSGPAMLPG